MWFRHKADAVSNEEFASGAEVAALGRGLLAVRVAGGQVPADAFAIAIGENVDWYPAGSKKVLPPKHGKLWWVHSGAQAIPPFAPQRAAPEAGVGLVVEPHLILGDPTKSKLPDWLKSQGRAVSLQDVVKLLAGAKELQLSPCVQSDELARAMDDLTYRLIREVGLRCTQLERVDLYPDVDYATSAGQPAARPEPGAAQRAAAPAPAPAPQAREESLRDVLAFDAEFEHRLFIELPQLANRLRERPWPSDRSAFDRQRTVLRRLEHMAGTTGRLPALRSRINPKLLSDQVIRLLCAESRRAAQCLSELWIVLEVAHATTAASNDMDQIDSLVDALALAIARRSRPWWEVQ